MSDKKYKVKLFDDNRLTITLHGFNPFKSSKPLPTTRPDTATPIFRNEYMSVKDYKKLLKTTHRKLWDKDFTQGYFIFITLTLDRDLTYKRLLKEFHRFEVAANRKFGKFEYIRAIELQETIPRLHIHIVVQFNEKPAIFNQSIVESLWGLGICNVEPVFDIWGVLQYITQFKDHHKQKNNPYYTCFPRCARVISASQHFGVKIDCTAYREEFISAEHLNFILSYHFNEFANGNGKFVRVDEHRYFNENTGTVEVCKDRVFIRTTKEFIDSNFEILNQENKT